MILPQTSSVCLALLGQYDFLEVGKKRLGGPVGFVGLKSDVGGQSSFE